MSNFCDKEVKVRLPFYTSYVKDLFDIIADFYNHNFRNDSATKSKIRQYFPREPRFFTEFDEIVKTDNNVENNNNFLILNLFLAHPQFSLADAHFVPTLHSGKIYLQIAFYVSFFSERIFCKNDIVNLRYEKTTYGIATTNIDCTIYKKHFDAILDVLHLKPLNTIKEKYGEEVYNLIVGNDYSIEKLNLLFEMDDSNNPWIEDYINLKSKLFDIRYKQDQDAYKANEAAKKEATEQANIKKNEIKNLIEQIKQTSISLTN